jgi:hypothetical protein
MTEDENHGRAHFLYGQCWSTREQSDALWRTPKCYVRIAINEDDLRAHIEVAARSNPCKFQEVTYAFESKVAANREAFVTRWRPHLGSAKPGDWFAEVTSILGEKREAFDFEHEVRFVLFDKEKYTEWRRGLVGKQSKPLAEYLDEIHKLYDYKIDFNVAIRNVLLHPELTKFELKSCEMRLRESGVTVPITQSTLLHPKNFDIGPGRLG